MRRFFVVFTVFFMLFGLKFVVAEEGAEEVDADIVVIDDEAGEINNIRTNLYNLDWCANDNFNEDDEENISIDQEDEQPEPTVNRGNPDTRIMNLCKKLKDVRDLESQLDENFKELEDNARTMKENEQSLENRMLTAAGIATVGLGGMELAKGLAEQKSDEQADRSMTAYMETFRCSYGDGKFVKGGSTEIELPGGNDEKLMSYRSEYLALAAGLKERKESLGMKPGIESETILDKANMGLYDEENIGMTSGAYASLYRAKMGNEADQEKIAQEQEKSEKRVKTGATVAAVGAVATAAANYALNHDKKDKSQEILAKRREIKSDYNKLVKEIIDECNATIQGHKDVVKTFSADVFNDPEMKQYKQDVQNAKPISTLAELKDSVFCK